MDEETPEILGQMMIDDSNWFTSTAQQMTRMVRDCDRFVNFHGLKFNKNKCEYMAIHQSEKVNEEGRWESFMRLSLFFQVKLLSVCLLKKCI